MIQEEILEYHYGEIANQLNQMIPVEWIKIAMLAIDTGLSSAVYFYFYTIDGKAHYSSAIPDEYNVSQEIYNNFVSELRNINAEFREEFVKASIEPWESMTFILNADWSFSINYSYDTNIEMGKFERRVIWAYEELGIYPEDEFEKEILEEYLEEKEKNK